MSAPFVSLSEPLLTADDVARLLSLKRSTVFELSRRRGDPLPSVKLGRSKRFIRPQVEEWVAKRSVACAG